MWDFPIWPESASTVAPSVEALYLFIVALNIGITALVFGLLVLFSVLYYRRADDQVPPSTTDRCCLRSAGRRFPR